MLPASTAKALVYLLFAAPLAGAVRLSEELGSPIRYWEAVGTFVGNALQGKTPFVPTPRFDVPPPRAGEQPPAQLRPWLPDAGEVGIDSEIVKILSPSESRAAQQRIYANFGASGSAGEPPVSRAKERSAVPTYPNAPLQRGDDQSRYGIPGRKAPESWQRSYATDWRLRDGSKTNGQADPRPAGADGPPRRAPPPSAADAMGEWARVFFAAREGQSSAGAVMDPGSQAIDQSMPLASPEMPQGEGRSQTLGAGTWQAAPENYDVFGRPVRPETGTVVDFQPAPAARESGQHSEYEAQLRRFAQPTSNGQVAPTAGGAPTMPAATAAKADGGAASWAATFAETLIRMTRGEPATVPRADAAPRNGATQPSRAVTEDMQSFPVAEKLAPQAPELSAHPYAPPLAAADHESSSQWLEAYERQWSDFRASSSAGAPRSEAAPIVAEAAPIERPVADVPVQSATPRSAEGGPSAADWAATYEAQFQRFGGQRQERQGAVGETRVYVEEPREVAREAAQDARPGVGGSPIAQAFASAGAAPDPLAGWAAAYEEQMRRFAGGLVGGASSSVPGGEGVMQDATAAQRQAEATSAAGAAAPATGSPTMPVVVPEQGLPAGWGQWTMNPAAQVIEAAPAVAVGGPVRPEDASHGIAQDQWPLTAHELMLVFQDESAAIFRGTLFHERRLQAKMPATPQVLAATIRLENEKLFLRWLRGDPGFVTFYKRTDTDVMAAGQDVFIMLELAAGNLEDLVLSKSFLEVSLHTRVALFVDIIRAAHDMDLLGYDHFELVPRSVLIIGDCSSPRTCSAVLCDSGGVCSSGSGASGGGKFLQSGNAPAQRRHGSPRDMWPFGVIFLRLLTDANWVDGGILDQEQVLSMVQRPDFSVDQPVVKRMLGPAGPALAAIVRRMLDPQPATRPTAEEVVFDLENAARSMGFDLVSRDTSLLDGWGNDPEWHAFSRQYVSED